ncbi:MAG: toprim domain-containing protein [Nanoarchaeota archaeon]
MKNFEKILSQAKGMLIVVEGKKDKIALEKLGFEYIFVINETGHSLYEKIEEIEKNAGKKKICILTDFDKKGKKLYLLLKSELGKRRVKLDNAFREALLKQRVSHIEGLSNFMDNG